MRDEMEGLFHEDENDLDVRDDEAAEDFFGAERTEADLDADLDRDLQGDKDSDGEGVRDEDVDLDVELGPDLGLTPGVDERAEAGPGRRLGAGAADDDTDDTDVELGLDEVLRERLATPEDDGDEEAPELVAATTILEDELRPRRDDEFVCRSCFLVKHRRLLADADRAVCVDCFVS
jgi:hypothetical protein